MRKFGRVLATAMVLMLFAMPAQAQINNPSESTDTTLYFHIFDTFNKFVINTQKMDTTFFDVGGTNFPTIVGTPLNGPLGADYDFNTIYGTSTAGPVEYGFIENGRPRFHPERGIAADVKIDTSVDPVVYMYVDVRDFVGLSAAPNALPNFNMKATVRTGDDTGPDAVLDNGELIMDGIISGTLCSDANEPLEDPISAEPIPIEQLCAAGVPDALTPDEDGIIELAIPMTLATDTIPQDEAFNIRIDWWQEDPVGLVCGEDQCAEGYMRLSATQTKQPRLEFAILNPVYISFIHPQVAAGTLLIHTGVNSPWGTYDIDPSNITLTVDGPTTPQSLEQVVAQNQHVHGLHHLDAEITYLWKFRDEGAANGEYIITMTVPNGAGTATAKGVAGFEVHGKEVFGVDTEGEIVEPTTTEDSEGSPGVGILAVFALLGVAFFRRH